MPSCCPASQVAERYKLKEDNLPAQPIQAIVLISYASCTRQDQCAVRVVQKLVSSARVHCAKGNIEMQREGYSKSVACCISGQESQKSSYPIFIEDREHSLSQPAEGN